MKYLAIAALLGLVSAGQVEQSQALNQVNQEKLYVAMAEASSSDSSDSDSSDDEDVQLKSKALTQTQFNSWLKHDDDDEAPKEKPYPHWMDGFGGYHTYKRDIPDRFETTADDTLMRSLYKNYATEGEKDGLPNGHFWVTKEDAKRVSKEVVETHLGLHGADADGYLGSNFDALWSKYDVNEEGRVEIDRMPTFLRSMCGSAEGCIGLQ